MPQITTAASQEAARTSETLSKNMDRVSTFAFNRAEQAAKVEGERYGALNAPSMKQLQDAAASGKDVEELVPGDTSTVFGSAARSSALEAMTLRFESKAREEITALQSQFENQEIDLDTFGSRLTSLVEQQTDVLAEVDPLAAQKFSAAVGVAGNSAYLSAAKTQAKRNKNRQEIEAIGAVDQLITQLPDVVAAGPTVTENGETITVDQKLEFYRSEILSVSALLDSPEFAQSKLDEFNKAATEAKISVVLDAAMENPALALRVGSGEGSFEDTEAQAAFESLSSDEQRDFFDQLNIALSEQDSIQTRQEDIESDRVAQRTQTLVDDFNEARLNRDFEAATNALETLYEIDRKKSLELREVLETQPGIDDPDTISALRKLRLNNELTIEEINKAYVAGNLSDSSQNEFINSLKKQRQANYRQAVNTAKRLRGLPDKPLINYNDIQRQADQEVADIILALDEAIDKDPTIDRVAFVKEQHRLLEEQGGSNNSQLRQHGIEVRNDFRTKLNMPNATAQQIYNEVANKENFFANDQMRESSLNALQALIDLNGED
jgi:hypothetical protein